MPDNLKAEQSLLPVFRKGLRRFYFHRLSNVIGGDVRSYKLVCLKWRQVNAMEVCNC